MQWNYYKIKTKNLLQENRAVGLNKIKKSNLKLYKLCEFSTKNLSQKKPHGTWGNKVKY